MDSDRAGWTIERGQLFNWGEVEVGSKVIVLGQTVAEHLFAKQDPIGQMVRVRRVPFSVIGILSRNGHLGQSWDQDDMVMVPITTAKVRLLGLNRVHPSSVAAIQNQGGESGSPQSSGGTDAPSPSPAPRTPGGG